jgi:DNA-binding transcriptional regulator LsrR (DeoR family)
LKNLLEEHDLIIRVAWLYYNEEMTQKEIAKKLGISRFKVMDLISEAKENGILQINIVSPLFNNLSIESELKKEFDLSDAVVIPTPNKKNELTKFLGIAGSNYLHRKLKKGEKLGTAWGKTIFELINYFPNKESLNNSVVLMIGGLSNISVSLNPFGSAKELADKLGGVCYYIFSPAIVNSQQVKETMLSDENISSVLEMARSVNKAIVGIGETTPNASLVKTNFITEEELKKLKEKGAVGDILGRYYDINGNLVDSDINKKIIGINLKELQDIEKVIGIAGGKQKIKSIYGALQGNYLDVLITEENCAKELLKLKKQS